MNDDIKDELPRFEFDNSIITISGKSIPFDAKLVWGVFVAQLEIYIKNLNELTINFKLDIFNSSSSLYLTDIFKILESYRYKKKIVVNWYYFEADEMMQELGELHQERCKFEFNLMVRK